ncbi:MAG: hemolysin family protein [Treponema sp.]|jgi:CBS domain containing-hemolysin-like protein|nr:hemolysin family protein [Treponema sp.]
MDDSRSYYLLLFISLAVLLGLNLFFSLCETSFSALSRIKLKNIAAGNKNKRRASRARLVLKMLESYDKLLSSILIGNTIVNITASALAAVLFFNLFGAKGVGIATMGLTLIVLLFCEISPKTLAKESPELTAIRVSPFMRFFIIIFSPFSYLTGAWKKVIVKIFPVKADRTMTEDELLTFVEEVRQDGGINIHEEQMIRQAIDFDDLIVSEIYTPRIDVAAVSEASTIEEIDRVFIETGFSRLPIFQDSIDNIKGVILLKDFYHKVMKGLKTLPEIINPVVFITKTIKIAKLLKTLQAKQSHLAVIVDEHGGTLGIVTIEDIVEELIGEIWDEHDEKVEPVKKDNSGGFTVLGSVNFGDMLKAIAVNGIDEDKIPNTTVANWIMENLGRLPHNGEILTWQYLTIKVLKVIKQRVMEVKINIDLTKKEEKTDSSEGEGL